MEQFKKQIPQIPYGILIEDRDPYRASAQEQEDRSNLPLVESGKNANKLWAVEGESRIKAYEAGILKSIPLSQVFEELEIEKLRERGDGVMGDTV